jgi:hypothetical protein
MTPYKTAALRYMSHGWKGPLPVGSKPQQKTHPPTGYTGNDGTWPTEDQIVEWSQSRPNVNIALRLPKTVIGIDVDDYNNKPGADTMIATTDAHGRLPRTWISTSRQGRSGIRWFAHPQATTLPGKLVHPDDPDISGVEIIQHGHRYAIVPPSVHPEGGHYQWITPDGEPVTDGTLPKPDDFPEIPAAWLDHINQDCSCWAPFNWDRHIQERKDPVRDAYQKWTAKMTTAYGRHDAALGGVMALVAFKDRGWPGADHYLEQLKGDFTAALGDSRDPKQAELEWERMVKGALKKAATTTIPVWEPHQTTSQPSPETFDARVEAELDQLRVRDTARRRFTQETTPPQPVPAVLTLRERLARPHPPIEWRIEGWQPKDTRVLLAAQYKAGKTTLTGNLARCLVDNQPWLDISPVAPIISGHVTILDFEMSERQIDGWLADQQIENDQNIVVIPLRGRATTFDILDDQIRKEWAARLAGTEYVILDCLRPILDALALDEHREAGRFLTAFDALCDQADIKDGLVVHHMGHTGERSRGDSRLRDWPDVEWRLVRKTDEPDSVRYVSAFGRDVEYPEGEIAYDAATRHLKYLGGSRELAGVKEVLDDVLDLLKETTDPISQRGIIDTMRDRTEHARAAIKKAVRLGVDEALIHTRPGPHNSTLHHHISQCASDPQCAADTGALVRSAPHPFRGGALAHTETQALLEEQLGAQETEEELPDAY